MRGKARQAASQTLSNVVTGLLDSKTGGSATPARLLRFLSRIKAFHCLSGMTT